MFTTTYLYIFIHLYKNQLQPAESSNIANTFRLLVHPPTISTKEHEYLYYSPLLQNVQVFSLSFTRNNMYQYLYSKEVPISTHSIQGIPSLVSVTIKREF